MVTPLFLYPLSPIPDIFFNINSPAATILTFNLPVPSHLISYARTKTPPVSIIQNTIIYRLASDVATILESHLPPSITHKVTGEAEILQICPFTVKKKGLVLYAGCRVQLGSVTRGSRVKVKRAGKVIWTGVLGSLRNVKVDAEEMGYGTECGIGFEGDWEGFKVGDIIQCYNEIVEKKTLPVMF